MVNRVLSASSVQPQERPTTSQQVHGVWSLVTYLVEVKESDETFPPMGNNPSGYVIFTPEGRLAFTLSAEGRQAAESVEDSAGLLSSMIAYTGTYTLEQPLDHQSGCGLESRMGRHRTDPLLPY